MRVDPLDERVSRRMHSVELVAIACGAIKPIQLTETRLDNVEPVHSRRIVMLGSA